MKTTKIELTPDEVASFWLNVDRSDPNGCWEWTGRRKPAGYGSLFIRGKNLVAHRVAWRLVCGPIPPGMFICHHCDNPPCCNPDHLFIGTARDNVRDAIAKGRKDYKGGWPGIVRYGEHNYTARLTRNDVQTIRKRYIKGNITYQQLADEYGVTIGHIGRIINRQQWAHVK